MNPLLLIAEIEAKSKGKGYEGKLRFPDRSSIKDIPLRSLALGPGDHVRLSGHSKTLGEWVTLLAEFDPVDPSQPLAQFWNERTQLELGGYLAGQLFAKLPEPAKRELNEAQAVRLIVWTEDEFIARIPWACLVWGNNRRFAATGSWTIAVGSQRDVESKAVEFPRTPGLLVIAPEAKDHEATGADAHLEELGRILGDGDTSYRLDAMDNLRVVRSWAELQAALEERAPDVVYYYGHAVRVENQRLRLLFEDGTRRRGRETDVVTFGKLLENVEPRPFLIYVNCCQGDGEGPTGIGWQLSGCFDAVVTNRTTAFQTHARRQACEFLSQLVRKGRTPEESLRAVYNLAESVDLDFSEPHWMTPVLYVGYGTWAHAAPTGRGLHPHWTDLVDRSDQFGHVLNAVGTLLDHPSLKGHAFVWMGGDKGGVESFHNRLEEELQSQLRERCLLQAIRLVWPDAFSPDVGVDQLFGDMLRKALGVRSFSEIPERLRRVARAPRGQKILMYLRHVPLKSRQQFPPEYLKGYLEWWAQQVLPHLDGNQRCMLGISYRIPDAEGLEYYDELKNRRRSGLESCLPERAECSVLKPLGLVPEDDLAAFLRKNPIVPRDRIDKLTEAIVGVTGGHYTDIVKLLQHLLKHGLPVGDLEAWLRRGLGAAAAGDGGPKK